MNIIMKQDMGASSTLENRLTQQQQEWHGGSSSRESVVCKVKEALEGHARYLEYQMEQIRTSYGRAAAESNEEDDYSMRAEEEYLSEDERSIYNDLEELMKSIETDDVKKLLVAETEETVAGTFSEFSEEQYSFDEDYDTPKEQKHVIQVFSSPKGVEDELKLSLRPPQTQEDKEKDAVFGGSPILHKVEHHSSKASDSSRARDRTSVKWNMKATLDTSSAHTALEEEEEGRDILTNLSFQQERNEKSTLRKDEEERQFQSSEESNHDRDEISILEHLDSLVETLRNLSPEEFLREFDDDSFDGDLPETREDRINYLIDLLSSKAQDMYNQGEGLNIVYASGLLAARIHSQRNPLASMLPTWFQCVLKNLKAGKKPEWALSPTMGSTSADGKRFMPLCDSDDYHEEDPMLSDLEDLDDE